MATVTIRNLSDEVVAALKARAKRNSRSMEAEVRELLLRSVNEDGPDSGLEASLARRLPERRWSVRGGEVMAWIEANPAPPVDAEAWLADIRGDGDDEDFRNPWEPRDSA
ncbi:MAG: hypothetical protein P0Y60_01430 [Candidatus Microbacterium colombiense]|nr:MAG: hypothetical protein P0Y60_01430 [Microbacterium sp.]